MSYITKNIRIYGTELQFVKAFIDELTSADSRIICETTDIDEQYQNDSEKPVIIFNINNCYRLKFTRFATASNGASRFTVGVIINGNSGANVDLYFHDRYSYEQTVLAERGFSFKILSDDNYIDIRFASIKQSLPTYTVNTASVHSEGFNAAAYSTNTNTLALQSNFVRTDTTENGSIYTIADRLSHSRKNESIEVIKSKVLLKQNTAEYDLNNLFDCSAVTKDSVLTIDGANYYSLDEHTLVGIQ